MSRKAHPGTATNLGVAQSLLSEHRFQLRFRCVADGALHSGVASVSSKSCRSAGLRHTRGNDWGCR